MIPETIYSTKHLLFSLVYKGYVLLWYCELLLYISLYYHNTVYENFYENSSMKI
jgi:hypothetical protein